jgi:hypothetical protein
MHPDRQASFTAAVESKYGGETGHNIMLPRHTLGFEADVKDACQQQAWCWWMPVLQSHSYLPSTALPLPLPMVPTGPPARPRFPVPLL